MNCGSLPAELLENELFGHERSAYTGAFTTSPGLVGEAEGGTLFLDEIDSLPLLAQAKLLRFLQDGEYRPLGSSKVRHSDVRIIAASNADLKAAVEGGRLRRDLYYRLNIVPLRIPSLAERRDDVPLLAAHFLEHYVARFDKPGMELAADAVEVLTAYDWPGNVRELEHVLARAVVLSSHRVLHGADLDLPVRARPHSFREAKARVVAQFERDYIRDLLVSHSGNISRAAAAAGKNRRAFWELIRKHAIDAGGCRPELSRREAGG